MTPEEKARLEAKNEARAATLARWGDGTVQLTEDDCKHLTPSEVAQAVRLGRFEDIPPDKRLNRR